MNSPPARKLFSCCRTFVHHRKIILKYFETKLFSWVRTDTWMWHVQIGDFKIVNFGWTPRKIICITRWGYQNEHFVREFLQFSHFVASKSMFSYEFSYEILNSLPQNRCFVPGFRQFSSHFAKCHACLATAFAPCRHLTQP